MARPPLIIDQHGNPIPREAIARLREEVAGPTPLAGVRSVQSGHPADGLTPARLAAMHRAADAGDEVAYLELAEDIEERDLHYAAVLGTRKRQVCQLPMTVEAASEAAEDVAVADFLREWLKTDALSAAMLDMADAMGKGFSVLETMWDVRPGAVLPSRFVYRPQRWFGVSREDGETVMLRESVGLAPLAPHKFVVHRHPQKSGGLIRSGLARLVSWGWMAKAFTLRDWAVFVQNYGAPFRIGKYGPDASEADRRVLWRAVGGIAGDAAAIIPRSMEIEFVEAGNLAAAGEIYERRCEWIDRQVSKAVLGQTTTTDAVSGGHAVSREHRLVQEDIERDDARLLAGTITRQVFAPVVAFNFPGRAVPRCRMGRPDEVPLAQLTDSLAKLGPLGLEVEAAEVRDRLGLSEPAPRAVVIGGRPPPPPPPPPSPEANRPGPPPPVAPPTKNETHSAPAAAVAAPARGALLARLTALHAREDAEPDLVDLVAGRVSGEVAAHLERMAARVRGEVEAASDVADLAARLAALDLDGRELAEALRDALALAHLAGASDALDELGVVGG